jgi:hypothetical protein
MQEKRVLLVLLNWPWSKTGFGLKLAFRQK